MRVLANLELACSRLALPVTNGVTAVGVSAVFENTIFAVSRPHGLDI